MNIVYPLIGETWSNLLSFLFDLKDEWEEPFDVCRRHIIAIRPLNQGLSFEI
jgi:hypothetical protein